MCAVPLLVAHRRRQVLARLLHPLTYFQYFVNWCTAPACAQHTAADSSGDRYTVHPELIDWSSGYSQGLTRSLDLCSASPCGAQASPGTHTSTPSTRLPPPGIELDSVPTLQDADQTTVRDNLTCSTDARTSTHTLFTTTYSHGSILTDTRAPSCAGRTAAMHGQ